MSTTSTALFKAAHGSLHAVTRHPARTSSARLACSMIVNQSRRLHGQQQDRTSTAPAAHTSSLSLSLSRHAHRHYSSSSLQSQPPKQGQKTEDLQKQEESPFRGDENYGAFAGPAMHTLGVFRRIFRYAVFASVALVATGATLYVSVHTYVEYVALHGRARLPVQDLKDSSAFLPEELVPAFSGAHLGGGTDPSLTWRARNAARAAWIALNLSKGGISNGGASTIRDVAVPDMAWLSAERYLKFALQEIEKQNDTSPDTRETRQAAELELQFQLASLQSKLAGPRGLREARANWMDLLRKMADVESLSPQNTARWLELQRRLADVNVQLAALNKLGTSQSLKHHALQQLEDALIVVLTGNARNSAPQAATQAVPREAVPTQKASTGFSLRNLWTGSSENTIPTISQVDGILPALASEEVVQALKAAERPLSPPVKRAISRILIDDVATSAALKQLPRAEAICNASLGYMRDATSSIFASTPEDKLYKTYMNTQTVLLQCYLAELLAAQRGTRKLGLSKSTSDENTRNILYEAVEASKQSLAEIKNFDKTPGFNKSALQNLYPTVREAAQRAAGLAHTTRAVLAEVQDKDYLSALKDYEVAHEYANALKTSDTEYSTMHDRTLEGIRRCREKLRGDAA